MVLCLSYASRTNLLKKIGGHFQSKAIESVKNRKTLRSVGDNWNLKVVKRDMRRDSQNINYDWFNFVFIVNRIDLSHLSNVGHVGNTADPDLSVFILNDTELETLHENYKVLAARVIIEYLEKFKFMKAVVPDHIPHPYQRQMAQKSTLIPMPLMQKDEKYYNDMVDILGQGEKWIWEICSKAGTVQAGNCQNIQRLKNYTGQHGEPDQPNGHTLLNAVQDPMKEINCFFGGDQLTRVRAAGAADLRADTNNPTERFDHLKPFICEKFHTRTSLLQVSLLHPS